MLFGEYSLFIGSAESVFKNKSKERRERGCFLFQKHLIFVKMIPLYKLYIPQQCLTS